MKKLILLFTCISIAFLASSCDQVTGTGPVITSTRNVDHFKAIESTMSSNTLISIGTLYSVKIEAQKNIIDLIETDVEGDRLVIKTKKGINVSTDKAIIIRITMPEVTGIDVTGSGSVKILNSITNKSLHLDVSGSGDIETAAITAEQLEATITGSGNIKLASGTCKESRLSMTGTGDAAFGNLKTKVMNAELTGSGNADVNVSDFLKVSITGSGDVNYTGNAQVSAEVTGSGGLHKDAK